MVSGLILAGGKSTRFGANKCLSLFEGQALIISVHQTLSSFCDQIIVSLGESSSEEEYRKVLGDEVQFVFDRSPDQGPLFALAASFEAASGEYTVVAPCDTPFITPRIYKLIIQVARNHDAAVPRIRGKWNPLHGVYKTEAMRRAIDDCISQEGTAVRHVIKYLDFEEVTEGALRQIEPTLSSFININTRDDLRKASDS